MTIYHNDTDSSFSQLWEIQTDWFEEPNHRRGGWSGVVKYQLATKTGDIPVFIKRQENHFSRTWRHPIRGIPTFLKEYQNILLMKKLHLPTLDVVFMGVEQRKAVLVTKSLEAYISLAELDLESINYQSRRDLLKKIAKILSELHSHHLQYSSFYPKHIFVRQLDNQWDIKLIDLENMKKCFWNKQAMIRDLSTLDRHAGSKWSIKDRIWFLKSYFQEQTLSKSSKKIWQLLQNKDTYKRR